MRAAAIAALLGFSLAACKLTDTAGPQGTAAVPSLRTSVNVADAQTAAQLVSGFHQVENNAWRWTERQFTVNLATPRPADKGAVLAVRLTIPPPTTDALKTITLSASVAGTDLAPETYSAPGDYVYRRDVPANLLAADSVRVNFRLDKALPPGSADRRELGVVVQSFSLAAN
jgi:hypothetical protein